MKELDVRLALYNHEIKAILATHPGSLVIDELGLMEGSFRVDLAVINSRLHGYEIKSYSDNLDRLPTQQSTYNKIFDRMTLVADERHVAKAVHLVPQWWGLISSRTTKGVTVLNEIWPSRQNLEIDPYALSQLLWREEALDALRQRGLDCGVRTKPRKIIWQAVAACLTLEEIRTVIRHKLAARKDWRKHSYS
ncbi:hypothetical protein BH10CYA1_BH10CYA1_08680 [soil metagenome]